MAMRSSTPPPSDVYLYILMRTDLASLNPGKGMAQASHAANQCIGTIRGLKNGKIASGVLALLDEWESQTPGYFGTCIVLGVKERQMRTVVDMIVDHPRQYEEFIAEIVNDPTYPLMDGETLHLISLDTCAYVFGRKGQVKIFLEGLDLHP